MSNLSGTGFLRERPSGAPGNKHLRCVSTWRDQSRRLVLFARAVWRHTGELRAVLAVASIESDSEHDNERRTVLDGRRCGPRVRALVSDVRLGPLGGCT